MPSPGHGAASLNGIGDDSFAAKSVPGVLQGTIEPPFPSAPQFTPPPPPSASLQEDRPAFTMNNGCAAQSLVCINNWPPRVCVTALLLWVWWWHYSNVTGSNNNPSEQCKLTARSFGADLLLYVLHRVYPTSPSRLWSSSRELGGDSWLTRSFNIIQLCLFFNHKKWWALWQKGVNVSLGLFFSPSDWKMCR